MTVAAGVAFTLADDGDMRSDLRARADVSRGLGIDGRWATVRQVHGNIVVAVSSPGDHGDADAMFTTRPGLPLAVMTADCLPVVVVSPRAVGVAHAGWRGLVSGVLESLVTEMSKAGHVPTEAHVGPGIGPFCFEVGPEVAERFGEDLGTTTWGTLSVNLVGAARRRLGSLDVRTAERCTMHEAGHHSHRRDETPHRMAGIGWVADGRTAHDVLADVGVPDRGVAS
jgi:YfiH family protein